MHLATALPPNISSFANGFSATSPLSPPTHAVCHPVPKVARPPIGPALAAEPPLLLLSCCAPYIQYGERLSVVTLYSCAVGWLFHELQFLPSLTVTIVPWSLARTIWLLSLGLIHSW